MGRRSSRFRHAPHRLALHMPRRLASFPRKLARHVCLTTPVHPSPWQELEVYFFAERFEQQAAGGVVDPPVSTLAACAACEPRSLPHHRPFTRVDLFVQVACCGVGAAAACAPRRHDRHAAGTRARVVVWSCGRPGLIFSFSGSCNNGPFYPPPYRSCYLTKSVSKCTVSRVLPTRAAHGGPLG